MELRDRQVHFRIRDVYIPDPQKLLMELHGDDLLQGKVIDLSDSGTEKAAFAVVEVEGIEQPVIIPADRILQFL
jgi:hypothetical protein